MVAVLKTDATIGSPHEPAELVISTCPAVGMTADAARLEARATKAIGRL
jgi:hypothetical protein